ncbi:unnamed protein product [Cunninghamella echinulata]
MGTDSNTNNQSNYMKTAYQTYYRYYKNNEKRHSTLSPYIKKVADYAFKYKISHDQYKNLVPLLKDNEDVPKTLTNLKKVIKNDSYGLHLKNSPKQ